MHLDHEDFIEAARRWLAREEVGLTLSSLQLSSLVEQLEYAYEAGRQHASESDNPYEDDE